MLPGSGLDVGGNFDAKVVEDSEQKKLASLRVVMQNERMKFILGRNRRQLSFPTCIRVRSGVNCWPFLERRGKGNEKCTMKWGATAAVIGRV